jgi:hypothetical protein
MEYLGFLLETPWQLVLQTSLVMYDVCAFVNNKAI